MDTAPVFITTREAARYLGLGKSTLEHYRLYGGGPTFCRLGPKTVRYRKEDLDTWAAGQTFTSTSDPGQGGQGQEAA
jgi:excisionase family DNA binding protein